MNVFNRIAMSLLLLGLAVCALLFSLMPGTVFDSLRYLVQAGESGMGSTMQLLSSVVGLLVAVAAVLLLVAELKPRARKSVVVTKGAAGTAELATDSVALRVKRVAEAVPGIYDVSPTVRSQGKAVDILLRVSTDSDVDLPKKTEEVMQAVRSETESKIGIPVKSMKVTIKHTGGHGHSPASSAGTPAKDPFRS